MFGPPLQCAPSNVPWNHRPPQNAQWRPNFGARAPFGHRPRFNQFRPQLHQGNDNYWCETCDRGFPTEDILNKHKQQHQKCNIDGCQFVAHPKVITKHIQMQHSSGLYKKIANINKPEDIEKWREERRKRYPTKANIDKKAAFLQEKIERGEKMGLNKRHFKDNAQGQGVKRKHIISNENHPRLKFQRTDNPTKRPPRKNTPKALPVAENNRKLKPFAGISNLVMDSDNEVEEPSEFSHLIEDDVCDESINENPIDAKSEPMVCGALSSLMCDYGSSDEEDQKGEKIEKTGVKESLSTNTTNNLIIKNGKEEKSILNQDLLHCDKLELKPGTELEKHNCIDLNMTGSALDHGSKSTTHIDKTQKDNSSEIGSIETTQDLHLAYNVKNNSVLGNVSINDRADPVAQENDNDSGPEEIKSIKDDSVNTLQAECAPKEVRKKPFIEKKRTFHRPQPKLPSTLLHKLLFREMQQERNIVLQCIRYVRKNNYFDKKE